MSDEKKDVMSKRDEAGDTKNAKSQDASAEDSKAETPLPKIDFSTFIFSLNSSALLHLGLMADPSTGRVEKNLPMARQTIDILAMLEEKTRGNLNKDEEQMLKSLLYDLRILYVKHKQ
jgi:hypothetical protein